MTIDDILTRGEGVALWRQIARQIEQDIRTNVLQPGDRLPTEWDLTSRFGVNRHTVRRALAALAETGIVRAEQGRGTFVQKGLIDYRISRRTRFSETLRAQERSPSGTLLSAAEDRADTRVAEALAIALGTPVSILQVLRHADSHAVAMATHIFPRERFPRIVDDYRDSGSVTAALAAAGVADFTRQRTQISARLPSPEETRTLNVSKTRPLLVTESVDVDMDGLPIEFGIARFPADRVQLIFES
tara:strand:- start:577 stop:1311 length:735 start_codon:yes stop_codon:yes gene_type:complete